MEADRLNFNGIDASTGEYLLELAESDLAKVALGQALDDETLNELKEKLRANEAHFGVKEGIDPSDLAQAGWGVVFPAFKPGSYEYEEQQDIVDALEPLLSLRREQAGALFKIYRGKDGFRTGKDNKSRWLARQGMGPGPADPDKVPYYLLIVGDPTAIPYVDQSQLGVQYAVGRVHFDEVEDYARYARSVRAAETGGLILDRRAAFFGVANEDDAATLSSSKYLVDPMAEELNEALDWVVESSLGAAATRSRLAELINGEDTPALLFTASHGMGFPKGHPLQLRHQGALLCQDWPGPKKWRKPVPAEHYFSADDVDEDASLLGSMAFVFACYGAGTPLYDEFSKKATKERQEIAEAGFVAGLPKALLNRENGGALAVVGHVERAWGCSFMWQGTGERGRMGPQTEVFASTLRALMGGMPVGAAMEYFAQRYAELSSDLTVAIEEAEWGDVDDREVATMWTANNDARGYAILGDPAVRLCVVGPGEAPSALQGSVSDFAVATAAPRAAKPRPAPGDWLDALPEELRAALRTLLAGPHADLDSLHAALVRDDQVARATLIRKLIDAVATFKAEQAEG